MEVGTIRPFYIPTTYIMCKLILYYHLHANQRYYVQVNTAFSHKVNTYYHLHANQRSTMLYICPVFIHRDEKEEDKNDQLPL